MDFCWFVHRFGHQLSTKILVFLFYTFSSKPATPQTHTHANPTNRQTNKTNKPSGLKTFQIFKTIHPQTYKSTDIKTWPGGMRACAMNFKMLTNDFKMVLSIDNLQKFAGPPVKWITCSLRWKTVILSYCIGTPGAWNGRAAEHPEPTWRPFGAPRLVFTRFWGAPEHHRILHRFLVPNLIVFGTIVA